MVDDVVHGRDPEIRVLFEGAEGVDDRSLADAVAFQARQLTGLEWRVERLFAGLDDRSLLLRSVAATVDDAEAAAIGLRLRREISAREDVAQSAVDLPVSAFDPDRAEALTGSHDRPRETVDPMWSHRLLRVEEAWAASEVAGRAARGRGVVVGHPDTGFSNHPAVRASILADLGFDTVDGDRDATDPFDHGFGLNPGHGTATASKIAGHGGGTLLGVAPEARVLPIRAVRGVVRLFDSDVARAVDLARRANVHVISMSLGGKGFFGLKRAIQRAVDAGIIVMAAAGNNVGFVVAPASYANTLAVGGTDFRDAAWERSSRGRRVDISAPAEAVHVAAFDWDAPGDPVPVVDRSDGTSFAVAQVAGVAALWLAHHGRGALLERYGASQLAAAFRVVLRLTARRPDGWSDDLGDGVIDALAMIEAELPALGDLRDVGAFREVDTAAERIAALLGDASTESIVAHATEMSGFADRSSVLAWLARNEDELAYLLLTDGAIAERLRSGRGAAELEARRVDAADVAARRADTAALVRVRPFDRQEVDLSALEDDGGQLTADAITERVDALGSNWFRSAESTSAIVTGHLDAPAGAFSADPLEIVANALLDPVADFAQSVRLAVRVESTSRWEVRHVVVRGQEVVGSDFRLRLDAEGRVGISGRVPAFTLDHDPGPPPVVHDQDIDQVCRDSLGLPTTVPLTNELVLFPTPDGLVWAHKLKALVEEPLADLRIYLRADDLSLLLSHDVVLASNPQADVYLSNPLRDPNTARVELVGLPAGAQTLAGPAFDVHPRRSPRLQLGNGSFLVAPQDPAFDEPNVWYHLTACLAWFTDVLGSDPLAANDYRPLRVLTRDRDSRGGRGQYVPADRSLRFDDLERTAARSADIVYHEFAHAVTDAECRLYRSPARSARGIAEGIADYVASSVLDDPRFGDYVTNIPTGARNCDDPMKHLRFSDADHNQEHSLGAVWAAMLWDLRTSLAAGVADRIVARSLRHLVPGSSLAHGVQAMVTADAELVGASGPGPNAQAIGAAYANRS